MIISHYDKKKRLQVAAARVGSQIYHRYAPLPHRLDIVFHKGNHAEKRAQTHVCSSDRVIMLDRPCINIDEHFRLLPALDP